MAVWDEEWRLGRLAEDNDGEVLKALKGRMFSSMPKRGYAAPAHRSSRPVAGDGRTVCFLRVDSRRKGVRSDREASLREARGRHGNERVYVFPPRGEAAKARAAGAVWDRRTGALYMKPDAAPSSWTGASAERNWAAREARIAARSGEGLAAAHLRYIERNGEADPEDIAADQDGALLVSNVGASLQERAEFWKDYEDKTVRDGQISHIRIVAELPHGLDDQGRRLLVDRMSQEFDRRGLPHVGIVHRPSPHGDPRNVHVHWILGDRPGTRDNGQWVFSVKKDRDLRGPFFVAWLRELHADIANGAMAIREAAIPKRDPGVQNQGQAAFRDGDDGVSHAPSIRRTPEALDGRRWYAGTYVDLGIDRVSQLHLGPHDAALERAGIPTWKGVANGAMEERYEALRAATEDLQVSQDRDRAMARVGQALAASLGSGPLEREASWTVQGAGVSLDRDLQDLQNAAALRHALETAWRRGERARRRVAWAERELARACVPQDVGGRDEGSPRANIMRAVAREAGSMVREIEGSLARDPRELETARLRYEGARKRVEATSGFFESAVQAHRREGLVGALERTTAALARLRKEPLVRERLARSIAAATVLGLDMDRLNGLPVGAIPTLIAASAANAGRDLLDQAHRAMIASGVASAGPSGRPGSHGDASPDHAVRAVGEVLRIERQLTRLEVERARARRVDPVAARAQAEHAVRSDPGALRLAVERGVLAPISSGAGRAPERALQTRLGGSEL